MYCAKLEELLPSTNMPSLNLRNFNEPCGILSRLSPQMITSTMSMLFEAWHLPVSYPCRSLWRSYRNMRLRLAHSPLSLYFVALLRNFEDIIDLSNRKHVFQDLRPNSCTCEPCEHPEVVYFSKAEYLYHELVKHDLESPDGMPVETDLRRKSKESIICPFCKERTGTGKNIRGAYIGRHMEEIAFAAVNSSLQEWDFYSDSTVSSIGRPPYDYFLQRRQSLDNGDPHPVSTNSGRNDDLTQSSHCCTKINPATERYCKISYSRRQDLIRHVAVFHAGRDSSMPLMS